MDASTGFSTAAPALALDVMLIALIASQTVSGARRGLARILLRLLGLVAGGLGAWLVVPLTLGWSDVASTRIALAVIVAISLVAIGGIVGGGVGRSLGAALASVRLGALNRILGAAGGFLTTTLVIGVVASTLTGLGAPWLTPVLSSSATVRTIESLMPAGLRTGATEFGQSAAKDLPGIVEALGGLTESPTLPEVDLDSEALTQAARSVVRISGTAYACGQEQTGSGFVVADGRVVTNAHVVAGVTDPVVEAPGERAKTGRVTYYDASADLAVIDVDGLDTQALKLASGVTVGERGAVQGYPGGGPFVSGAAQVVKDGVVDFSDSGRREVLTLAAKVRPGNSGGPFLDTDGRVAGVVFAKERSVDDVGYALTLSTLQPVATAAPGLTARVSTGQCTVG